MHCFYVVNYYCFLKNAKEKYVQKELFYWILCQINCKFMWPMKTLYSGLWGFLLFVFILLFNHHTPCRMPNLPAAFSVDLQITQQGALREHCSYHPFFADKAHHHLNKHSFYHAHFLKFWFCSRTWMSQIGIQSSCHATGIASHFLNTKLYLFNMTSGPTTDTSLLV